MRQLNRVVTLLHRGRHVGIQATEPGQPESANRNHAQQDGSEHHSKSRANFPILPSFHCPSPLQLLPFFSKLVLAKSIASLRAEDWERRGSNRSDRPQAL